MSKQFNDMREAVNLATKLLTTLGYTVHHDPTVDPVSGVWDIDTPAGRRQSACEAGALCRLASQAVDDFVTSRDMPRMRDCSRLTMSQLQFLADVPGNADVVAELEKRRAQPVMYTTQQGDDR